MKELFAFIIVLVAAFTLPTWASDPASAAGSSVENRTSGSSAAGVSPAPAFALEARKESHMKIRLSAGNTVLTATMLDNVTSRDFMSLLPLTETFKDYAGTEKITYLPKRLSTKGAPAGTNPSVGDIAYYAPW
ncbi:MAG: flavodoxin, partial [Proteobacteria bacterium]|nr:flavodoxin [Pseudomonadota bacterium]